MNFTDWVDPLKVFIIASSFHCVEASQVLNEIRNEIHNFKFVYWQPRSKRPEISSELRKPKTSVCQKFCEMRC